MALVELPGFDEAVRRHTWLGSKALTLYQGDRYCSRCGFGSVVRMTTGVQTALFYFGGYGAAERKTVDVCLACGRVVVVGFETLREARRTAHGAR
jgi:hypothetical protein